MILNTVAEKLKRRSKDDFKGRQFEAAWNCWLAILSRIRSVAAIKGITNGLGHAAKSHRPIAGRLT